MTTTLFMGTNSGWYVEAAADWPDVWVLNEKQFPAILTKQRPLIDEADVHLLTYHLKRYVLTMPGK